MSNPDHFERLGLPRRFAVDAAELERQYLARSRAVHPDFHLSGPPADLAASLESSAALNEAYDTLKDPFRRAEYLLTLLGGPSAAGQKDVGPAFLMEMLEVREDIERVRAGDDAGEAERLRGELDARLKGLLQTVADRFGRDPPPLAEIRRSLNETRYVEGLIRDLAADDAGW